MATNSTRRIVIDESVDFEAVLILIVKVIVIIITIKYSNQMAFMQRF